MKIVEIIAQEDYSTIQLYKQGVFWVAYEQSAYAVWKITNYRPSKKYIKCIGEYVVSLGFPDAALENLKWKKTTSILENAEKYKRLLSFFQIDKDEFEQWKKSLNLAEKKENNKEINRIEEAIKNFPLETKTAIEAFLFIEELQKNIKNHNNGLI
ncbi:hypothetical protein [Chryseobacterium sp.]|uniref:hypothetical protein n=1 Tax=Chryseobacterium sp. TaxID=1871047 RepID=UPI0035B0194C